jgi:hypothetical protein
MTFSRRELLERSAAASALSALGLPEAQAPQVMSSPSRLPHPLVRGEGGEGVAMIFAGVVIETVPGAEPRVAARLLRLPGVKLEGGDGRRRIAAVLAGPRGATLEQLTGRLLAGDEEILGVFPTFLGADDGPP